MARLFLVEDDLGLSEPLAGFLTSRGHAVYAFDSAGRALEFLRTNPWPDLVLLDLLLRADMNGWQFVEEVRRLDHGERLPIIAMSGAPLNDAERRQCHADAFLPKPFELVPLLDMIDLFTGAAEASHGDAAH